MLNPVLEDADKVILEKTLNLRTRMLDVFARKADDMLPTKPSEMLAIAQLAASIDQTVISRAKLRLDQDGANKDQENKRALLDLIKHLHQSPSPAIDMGVVEAVDVSGRHRYVSNSEHAVSTGELIRQHDDIEMKDIQQL